MFFLLHELQAAGEELVVWALEQCLVARVLVDDDLVVLGAVQGRPNPGAILVGWQRFVLQNGGELRVGAHKPRAGRCCSDPASSIRLACTPGAATPAAGSGSWG
jgi:hypothetical protein